MWQILENSWKLAGNSDFTNLSTSVHSLWKWSALPKIIIMLDSGRHVLFVQKCNLDSRMHHQDRSRLCVIVAANSLCPFSSSSTFESLLENLWIQVPHRSLLLLIWLESFPSSASISDQSAAAVCLFDDRLSASTAPDLPVDTGSHTHLQVDDECSRHLRTVLQLETREMLTSQ